MVSISDSNQGQAFTFTPDEKRMYESLTPQEQRGFSQIYATASKIAQEKPYLNTQVYDRFLHDYLVEAINHRNQVNGMIERAKASNVPISSQNVAHYSQQLNNEFSRRFNESVQPDELAAWKELAKEMQPESIFSGPVKQIYDTKKGGFQFDGAIGALIGGALAYSALGTSSWLGIIGIAVASLLGAWLGNKATDMFGGYFGKGKDGPSPDGPAQAIEQAQAPAPVVEPQLGSISDQLAKAARSAAPPIDIKASSINPGQDSNLVPAPTYTAPPAPPSGLTK